MEINLDCDRFSEIVSGKAWSLLKQSRRDQREKAAYIYETKKKLWVGRPHTGEKYGVQMSAINIVPRLLGDIDIVGTMHTHPDVEYDDMLSVKDIEMLLQDKIQIAVLCYREGDKAFISVYESDPAEEDPRKFIEGNRGSTPLETLQNINQELNTCRREIWPLN